MAINDYTKKQIETTLMLPWRECFLHSYCTICNLFFGMKILVKSRTSILCIIYKKLALLRFLLLEIIARRRVRTAPEGILCATSGESCVEKSKKTFIKIMI